MPNKLVIIFLLVAALFTGSRGSLLGMILFLTFLYLEKLSFFKIFVLAIIFGILCIAIYYTPFIQQILRLDNPLSQRDLLFVLGLQTMAENPFFGVGPGGFSNIAYSHGYDLNILDLMKGGVFGSSSHNVYIDAHLEAGIIGFLALIFLYYSILKKNDVYDNGYRIRSAFIKSYLIISIFGSKVILGGAVTEGLIIWLLIVIIPTLNKARYCTKEV